MGDFILFLLFLCAQPPQKLYYHFCNLSYWFGWQFLWLCFRIQILEQSVKIVPASLPNEPPHTFLVCSRSILFFFLKLSYHDIWAELVNAFFRSSYRYVVNLIWTLGAFLVTERLKYSCQSLLRTDCQMNDTGLEWQIFSDAQ